MSFSLHGYEIIVQSEKAKRKLSHLSSLERSPQYVPTMT